MCFSKIENDSAKPGVPNLGDMYPWEYICLSKGAHLRLAIKGENIFIYYLFPNTHTSVYIIL